MMTAFALLTATPVLARTMPFCAKAAVQLRVLPYTAVRMAVIEARACPKASLPTCSCFRAPSSETTLRFLLERSLMAAANAVPTAGRGAVGADELGLLLDDVMDGSGAVVDVACGVVMAAVETGAARP